jgi:hypothetical protein
MAEETPPRAGTTGACSSFNHLVGAQQERLRNGQAECLGGREIDDEIEFGGLLDRKIARLGATQNLVDILGRTPERVPARLGPLGAAGRGR